MVRRDDWPPPKSKTRRLVDKRARALHKRAGRWLEKPKKAHEIILRALELANRATRRAVCVSEVLQALTPKEVKILRATYSACLSTAASSVLNLLCGRGYVFSPGKLGVRRFYGAMGLLPPTTVLSLEGESRRQRVLRLVRQTVTELGRAVRMRDILEHAAGLPEAHGLKPADISHDVLSLKEEGELRHIGSVRGDGKGINLYLPTEFNPEDYLQPSIHTWLEEVACTFNELWSERIARAAIEGKKPSPITTGEVRARLRVSSRYPENLATPMVLINAMQQLAQTRNPLIRKIKRPRLWALLWAPAGVEDSALDVGNAYASDAERIGEAVRRAEQALARPVTLRDVQDQINLDPSLSPAGSSRPLSVLAEAAKKHIASGENGSRRHRAVQRVHRIGKVADISYYSTSSTPESEAFINFKRLELRWSAMHSSEEIESIKFCSLPSVAIGRAMQVLAETSDVMSLLKALRGKKHLRGEQRQQAELIFVDMMAVSDLARAWINDHGPNDRFVPEGINVEVHGLTVDELLELIRPLYPRSQTLIKNSRLVGLMGDAIRRVPNPEYVNRFAPNQRLASEYLFDRTDALSTLQSSGAAMNAASKPRSPGTNSAILGTFVSFFLRLMKKTLAHV